MLHKMKLKNHQAQSTSLPSIRYLQEGSRVYMCLYDLQKAFDSVEFPVLLKRLFDIGVNSKTWHLLRSWYTDCKSSVRLKQHVSPTFPLERGVHSLTSLFLARHGPPPKTTPVSVYRRLSKQHLCRWIPTCGRHPHACLQLNNSGSTDLISDTVH